MTSLSIKEVKVTSVLIVTALLLSCSLFLGSQSAHAARNYTNCPETIYSMLFVDPPNPVYGKTYVKLANKIPDSNVTLYSQDENNQDKCAILGQSVANNQTWNSVTDVSQADHLIRIYADGPVKSADVYQSTVKLLVLPEPGLCESVDSECHIKYQGHSGVLKPILQTGATDMIAIYTVKPINSSTIKEVAYFSDGSYLYNDAKKQIGPVNRNYLADGKHTVVTEVTFTNGQKMLISQTIDMGKDYSGFTTVKSYYYKSHNRYLYIIATVVIFIIVSTLLWLTRTIHQKREFAKDHGIDHLKAAEITKEDPKDKIVVG